MLSAREREGLRFGIFAALIGSAVMLLFAWHEHSLVWHSLPLDEQMRSMSRVAGFGIPLYALTVVSHLASRDTDLADKFFTAITFGPYAFLGGMICDIACVYVHPIAGWYLFGLALYAAYRSAGSNVMPMVMVIGLAIASVSGLAAWALLQADSGTFFLTMSFVLIGGAHLVLAAPRFFAAITALKTRRRKLFVAKQAVDVIDPAVIEEYECLLVARASNEARLKEIEALPDFEKYRATQARF